MTLLALFLSVAACHEPAPTREAWVELPRRQDGVRAYVVAGQVVDSAGRPLAGVAITVGEGFLDQRRGGYHDTTSDAAGRFRVEGLSGGPCEVFARAPGFASDALHVGSGNATVRVVLHRAAKVSGRMVDASGQPVAGELLLLSEPRLHPGNEFQFVEVGEDGRFEFKARPPGRFEVRAVSHDGKEAELALSLQEGAVHEGLEMRVTSPWRSFLRLRILDADGHPLDPDALDVSESMPKPHVDVEGNDLILSYREPPDASVRLDIQRNDKPALDLELRTRATRSGAARSFAIPNLVPVRFIADRKIAVDVHRGEFWTGVSGAEDWWLSPGCRYDLRIRSEEFAPAVLLDWSPPAKGGIARLPIPPTVRTATLRGRVVELTEEQRKQTRIVLDGEYARMRRGPDGSFTLVGVYPGRRSLGVRGPLSFDTELLVEPGATHDLGELRPIPTRRLRGIVRDPSGQPVGGAFVAFVARSPVEDEFGGRETYTHADGRFEFLAPGVPGDLLIQREPFGTTPFALPDDASSSPLRIALTRPARLRVSLGAGMRSPRFEWTCRIRWPDRAPHLWWKTGAFLPDEFEIAAGRIEVVPSPVPIAEVTPTVPPFPPQAATGRPGAVLEVEVVR
ncbi:MAG: carboxypeptidase-like regulatory domain-containing protein [Planctomycetota bacterium]